MQPTAQLGKNGPQLSRLGYGAMVLEGFYGPSEETDAQETLRRAAELGLMIDTADAYGNGHNEELIGKALRHGPTGFIASKFGIVFEPGQTGTEVPTGWGFTLTINGHSHYAQQALDGSLGRLGVECIDLWYAHYPDPAVPIEETVEAMARGVAQGKARYLGLSNVTAEQVRRAHAVHPITAVQYEYSLWRREAETELLPTLRELGIALVGWSPLGGGFLTGTVSSLDEQDFRQHNPRYQGATLQTNRERFAPLLALANELGISPTQLALAWLLHQGEDVFPIPGTRSLTHLEANRQALEVTLSTEVLARIEQLAKPGLAQGATLL